MSWMFFIQETTTHGGAQDLTGAGALLQRDPGQERVLSGVGRGNVEVA